MTKSNKMSVVDVRKILGDRFEARCVAFETKCAKYMTELRTELEDLKRTHGTDLIEARIPNLLTLVTSASAKAPAKLPNTTPNTSENVPIAPKEGKKDSKKERAAARRKPAGALGFSETKEPLREALETFIGVAQFTVKDVQKVLDERGVKYVSENLYLLIKEYIGGVRKIGKMTGTFPGMNLYRVEGPLIVLDKPKK